MGFFSGIGNFFGSIGRGIARGARAVGSFISGTAKKVGDFVRNIDFSKVGDIAGKVGDVARTIGGLGIPVVSTIASGVARGADLVKGLSSKGEKIKEGIDVARQVGGALENPSPEGLVGAGRRAFEFGKSLRR